MTNTKTTFAATPRTIQGKKVKQLRQEGVVPANVMMANRESIMIGVGQSDFVRLYNKVGDTGLVYLTIDGEKGERPVLVADVVYHPVTGVPEHVVFKQVNLKEKISAEVPVEVVGESPVKDAVVLTVVNEIMVEALPTDLPEKFEVDVSVLTEIGQQISFAELKYDRSKITLELGDQDESSPVVILQEMQEEAVEETPVAAEGGAGAESAAAESKSDSGAEAKTDAE